MTSGTSILISAGTRPEIIKMAPVYAELQRRDIAVQWVHTHQHREMADALYGFFGIKPAHMLDFDRQNDRLAHLNSLLLEGLAEVFERARPRAVLVHGDTTSTLAAAMAAFYQGVPLGHVEAGLRTHNAREPFPEEKNRELTARLAQWHFAPTAGAAANLAHEGIDRSAIHAVGNTVIDAAHSASERLAQMLATDMKVLPAEIESLRRRISQLRLITVTAHRRENWGDGIRNISRAVATLLRTHADLAVVWPVHANPTVGDAIRGELASEVDALEGRLTLCAPLDYPALLWCLQHSVLTLTDSGGIQEEGAALSTPVLVLRNTTERPELLDAGAGRLVGTDEQRIVDTVNRLLADRAALTRMRNAVNPFGDGRAAARIADILQRDLGV